MQVDFYYIESKFLPCLGVWYSRKQSKSVMKWVTLHPRQGPASWSSDQSFWLLIMKSRVRFPVLPWGFFLEGEDSHGDPGLGSVVERRLRPFLVLHIHISPSTSSGQRNCAPWASQPEKSVTLRPQPGGEIMKSIRDICRHWVGGTSHTGFREWHTLENCGSLWIRRLLKVEH
jgi:hypothetical protein